MELTANQRTQRIKDIAQEAGWARLKLPSIASNKPDAVNDYHSALNQATKNEKNPEWAKSMGLASYDPERHQQDIGQAKKWQQDISASERGIDPDHEAPTEGELPEHLVNRLYLAESAGSHGDPLPDYAATSDSRDYLEDYKDRAIEEQASNAERRNELTERFQEGAGRFGSTRQELTPQLRALEAQNVFYAENIDAAEDSYNIAHAKDAEAKTKYTGDIVAIKDRHAYQRNGPGNAFIKHDMDKLTVSKDAGKLEAGTHIEINYPTNGETGIARKPELEAAKDTHQRQKKADFGETPF